jgi:Uma2 family endonuclease
MTFGHATTISVRTRRWTRLEYERLIDVGIFRPDERLELVGGELTVREPQGGPHALAMELVGDALRSAFGHGWRVRVQLPVALDDESEPEPDFSIVRGTPRQATEPLPSNPALVVEVAETSDTVAMDRLACIVPLTARFGSGRRQ